MNTPYLVVKEILPGGRLAWRRMLNTQFSPVPAVDVAYQQRLHFDLKPIYKPIDVVNHKPVMVVNQSLILPNLVFNPSSKV